MELFEKISVIVPVYNVEKYLVRCVESLLNQTYGNLEIILVDDGSPDGSGAICDSFTDPRVKVIHKENGGLSSARNAGMDAATGEYIGFIDSDDWIEPDMFETMLRSAKENDVKLVCIGNWDVDSKTGEKTLGVTPKKTEIITGTEFAGKIFRWDGCDSSACDKLYHRSLLEGFRYPIGVLSEDVAVTYKIALKADKVSMIAKPFYYYYHHPESITNLSVSEKTFHYPEHTRAIYEDVKKNYPAIEPDARYLRVRAVYYLALRMDLADEETRKQYAERIQENRKELRKHLSFLLKSPLFGKQEKLTAGLMVANVYRTLRPVFTRHD